jgi:hypothetical protein
MKTQAQPWAVHERTLTDGSKVYDVWCMRSDGVGVPEVTIHAHSESAAYICADELNAAIAKARGGYVCVLCGQRIDDGKPCGCGARS